MSVTPTDSDIIVTSDCNMTVSSVVVSAVDDVKPLDLANDIDMLFPRGDLPIVTAAIAAVTLNSSPPAQAGSPLDIVDSPLAASPLD